MASTFDRLRNSRETVVVLMNEAKIALFPPYSPIKNLITEGLNGCSGIVIISPYAGILAHIPPIPRATTDPTAGMRNVNLVMARVEQMYRENLRYFPTTHTWTVAAMYQSSIALQEQVTAISTVLTRLGLSPRMVTYDVVRPGMTRTPDKGTIIITAIAQGQFPIVMLDGRRLN